MAQFFSTPPGILNEASLDSGIRALSRTDPDLAAIVDRLGSPPLWARDPGFPTLVLIILEQQVSLASARAAFHRLQGAVSPLTPAGFLTLDDLSLKAIGFSRQKTAYCRILAEAIIQGTLDLERMGEMDDDTVRSTLLQVKGIGQWTADIYLLMALRRPNIWPSGDLAIAAAIQEVKRLPSRPSRDEIEAIGKAWHPWRAIAARILWHYYLNGRKKP